jgi:CBS domain-containing protein
VVLPLPGETLAGAVEALAGRLSALGVVTDQDKLRQRTEENRSEDVVALGGRAIILHYRTDAVSTLGAVLGVAPAPLALREDDEETPSARIIVLVVAPPRQAPRYLQLLGALAKVLGREANVEALLAEATAEAIAAAPAFSDYEIPEQLLVRDLMSEQPHVTTPGTPLRDAARQMIRAGVAALPVVEEDRRLVGLLGERDLLRHLSATLRDGLGGGPRARPLPPSAAVPSSVRDAMTRQVLCVAPDQPLAEVAALMSQRDINQVPVLSSGRLVGFLTRGDIVRKLSGF